MSLFGRKKKDEYSVFYDEDLGFDPSDPDVGEDADDVIDRMKGTVESGPCPFCGKGGGMKYYGNCFICDKCQESVSENLYYLWLEGYADLESEDSYDDVY